MRRSVLFSAVVFSMLVTSVFAADAKEKEKTPDKSASVAPVGAGIAGDLNPETFAFRSDEKMKDGVRVARVLRRDELPGGPWASGNINDYLLENEFVRIIVRGENRAGLAGVPGTGGVIDVALRDQMWDSIGGVMQFVTIDGKAKEVVYNKISLHDPQQGLCATAPFLLVEGHAADTPNVQVRTILSLVPGKPYLLLITHCANAGQNAAQIEIVDRVHWGTLPIFIGAYGIPDFTRRFTQRTHWMSGILDDFCLGIVNGPPDPIRVASVSRNMSSQIYKSERVEPGQTTQAGRMFILTKGDMAPILEYLLPAKGFERGVLEGQVTQGGDGKPVSDVQVEIRLMHKTGPENKGPVAILAFAITRPDASGHYRIDLPAGQYIMKTTGSGRRAMPYGAQKTFKIRNGEVTRFDNEQEPVRTIRVTAFDADSGKPIPAKMRIDPPFPAPAPYLGPDWQASGARSVAYLSPKGTDVRLMGGNYPCVFSCGPEYDIVKQTIRVREGQTLATSVTLKRINPTPGMISVDLNVPTDASPASRVSAKDLVLAAAGEGVEWLISGDLNQATDLREAVRAAGLEDFIRVSSGAHLSYQYPNLFGEFYVFPVPPKADLSGLANSKTTPKKFFDTVHKTFPSSLIAVMEPAANNASYLRYYQVNTRMGKSPFAENFDMGFDALEVAEGKAAHSNNVAWDMMNDLTFAGYPKLPLASSRCSSLYFNEPGYPRLYVLTGEDDPRQISETQLVGLLRDGKYFLTNGPIIEQKVDGKITSRKMTAKDATFNYEVRLTAAPWVAVRGLHINQNLIENFRQAFLTSKNEVLRFPFDEDSKKPYIWELVDETTPEPRDIFFSLWVEGLGLAPVVTNIGEKTYWTFAATPPVLVDGNGDGKYEFK